MSDSRVSVVIPAYNAERFLAEAVESALAQTHAAFEIIVVDDGSTDSTGDVARSLEGPIRVIETSHAGCVAARDAGLAEVRGDLVAFLDADDLWEPDKTALQLARLRELPEIDLSVAHFQNFWEDEIRDEAERYRDHPFSRPMAGYIVPTLIASRASFDRFGGFSTDGNTSDTGWFARAIERGAKLDTLPDVLLRRRLHRHNNSRVNPDDSVDGLFDLIRARRREQSTEGGE